MAPRRINYEDAPECGNWSRKSNRSRFPLKPLEVECIEENPRFSSGEEKRMAEEKALAVCDMQQFQDPQIDDSTALKLAVLLSGEEVAAADVCTDPNAGNLHDAASQEQEFSDDLSEATDNWDMCETASISSSWLDLQDDHAVSHVIDEEDIEFVGTNGLEEAAQKMAKPPSFAEILTRSIESSAGAIPRLVKPNWSASRMLKPIPEHQSNEQAEAIEGWELYKSSSAQHWNGKFRRGRKRPQR